MPCENIKRIIACINQHVDKPIVTHFQNILADAKNHQSSNECTDGVWNNIHVIEFKHTAISKLMIIVRGTETITISPVFNKAFWKTGSKITLI